MTQTKQMLNDICHLIIDCEHKTAPLSSTGYPSIRTPNIGRGRLLLDGVNRVSEETYHAWTKRAVPRGGDLILAREAPIGNVAIIPDQLKVCLGQRTVLIRVDRSKALPEYIVHLLLGDEIQGRILGRSNGSTVHHLNMKDIRELELPELPPLPTQRRIAAVLSAYDDLIENNQRRIALLEEMARSLYREWFVHFRFPGHEGVEIVERDGVRVPEGWEMVTVREVSSYINRGVAPKYNDSSTSLVINQKCIRDGQLNLALARRHETKVMAEKVVRFGDVLINSTGIGTLGRIAQVYQDLKDCTVDSHVSIVRPNSLVGIDYFGFYLGRLEAHFDSLGVGSTGQTELGRETIAKTNFLLPEPQLQLKFGEMVSAMRQNIIQLFSKNANLRRQRDLLLPRLVSGELDVSELEIAGIQDE